MSLPPPSVRHVVCSARRRGTRPCSRCDRLAIPAPIPPEGSFDAEAAERGDALFSGKAQCPARHVEPIFTEPGFATLADVVVHYDDHFGLGLSASQRSDLAEYLKSIPEPDRD